ncbi:helix-turn-helix domain-containing protein [Synechococcus sp.]|uniref:helix-turn-helix domain-containing protein n=1 Tax=Synechococcus sp. TaxID=1131 RepID=UPI0034A50E4B
MSPPSRETVTEISRATGISRQTLYSWRHLWKREGELVPASSRLCRGKRSLPPTTCPLAPSSRVCKWIRCTEHGGSELQKKEKALWFSCTRSPANLLIFAR